MSTARPLPPVLATLALLLCAGAAAAQSVHEILPGGDTVSGAISDPADVDRIPFRLVEGAVFSLSVKAGKGSALRPEVVVLGTDRRPDPAAAAGLVVSRKGNAVSLKNFAAGTTGLRWLEIRGAGGSTGEWLVKTKVRLPKKAAATGQVSLAPAEFAFTAPGNATTTVVVSAARGSAAVPAFLEVLDPDGARLLVDFVSPGKKGFALKGLYLPRPGLHRVRFTAGGDGGFSAKASFKVPKPAKRALLESQIITDPFLLSVTPPGGDTSQILPVTLGVEFGEPGAHVVFRKEPSVVTVAAPQVTVAGNEASFTLILAAFQNGVYAVEFVNPDGGKAVLPGAFTVTNAPAAPASVTPTFGRDNQVLTLTVTGTRFTPGATFALRRGADTIPGASPIGGGTQIQAQFDLRDRAIGLWDVVVSNPEAPEAVLPAAFDLRNSPPTLTSVTPRDNLLSASVPATLAGSDFDPVPTVRLRRTGSADIQGTSVLRVSSTEVTATFATGGAALGSWDVVLSNPDGQSATLPGAFRMSGSVAAPALVLSTAGTMDAPPAVAYGATRDEFAAAWIDIASGTTSVLVQRVGPTGTALGSPVSVSSSAGSVAKKDAAIAWDATNDEFLVAWCEPRSISVSGTHPSALYSSVFVVLCQRLTASDLTLQGPNVQVTDRSLILGWYVDEFNNTRPTLAWDPVKKVWDIAWMQEWSTQNVNNYGTDDYDVLSRTLDPSNGSLGTTVNGIAYSAQHEGDPSSIWDPSTQKVVTAFNSNASSTYLAVVLNGAVLHVDASADLLDPALVADPDSQRVLVTWTRLPPTGSRRVEAVVAASSNLGSKVGSVVVVGSGSGDHFLARPLYNPALKEAVIAWTLLATSPSLSVRMRRASTDGSGGLVLAGVETEASGGSGDEAAPAALAGTAAGESVLFWQKTMTLASTGAYKGSVVNGTYRAKELWIRRYR